MTVHASSLECSGRFVPRQWMIALALLGVSCLASNVRQPADPDEIQVAVDADDAQTAAVEAKAAAKQASTVAAHSVHIAHGTHRAMKQARDALRAVRASVETTTPSVGTAGNNLSAMVAEKLPSYALPANATNDNSDLEPMQNQLQQLRDQLADCKGEPSSGGTGKSVDQMDQELRDLQAMLQKLEAEEARTGKRGSHETLQGEVEHLRGAVARLEKFGRVSASLPPKVIGQHQGELRYRIPAKSAQPRVRLTPLVDLDVRSYTAMNSAVAARASVPPPLPQTTPSSGGFAPIDIDTQMPYGELEPFGREDTAQELTEASIRESDAMVDQLERAEVAEEKRAVFRALTRLRGAAITSFDGVANSQTGNIDEYNKVHQWRVTHPLNHLADEESDVTKWAFPDNADF